MVVACWGWLLIYPEGTTIIANVTRIWAISFFYFFAHWAQSSNGKDMKGSIKFIFWEEGMFWKGISFSITIPYHQTKWFFLLSTSPYLEFSRAKRNPSMNFINTFNLTFLAFTTALYMQSLLFNLHILTPMLSLHTLGFYQRSNKNIKAHTSTVKAKFKKEFLTLLQVLTSQF